MQLPKDLEEYVSRLMCPMCRTLAGRGFSVSAAHESGRTWLLVGKCLRCGFSAVARFESSELPPPAPAMAAAPEISSDESIDLHEALAKPDWFSQLTGGTA